MSNKYQFNNIEECKDQQETEQYYQERGWNILRPKLVRDGKCKHNWQKVAENDYQCSKCLLGYLGGDPNEA